ncbi:hypothetical protein [Oryza sativa Japonica Group]|uniref:Uncharacterized protein n=1 Tax=Oryza sativa subsp. japonica TaxID=39947 RepID=Q5QMS5_ORYSJ|nr:hypothetical protein [Oryza sativa Japonica Group]
MKVYKQTKPRELHVEGAAEGHGLAVSIRECHTSTIGSLSREERGEGDGWSSRARGFISVAILTGAQAQGKERE